LGVDRVEKFLRRRNEVSLYNCVTVVTLERSQPATRQKVNLHHLAGP